MTLRRLAAAKLIAIANDLDALRTLSSPTGAAAQTHSGVAHAGKVRPARRLTMTAPNMLFTAQQPRLDPAHMAWNTVASYDDYATAQRAVDQLSDDGFPVAHLDIVGSDLRLVERVTGRLTKRRAAAAGAASGAWFGLLIGLLLSLFSSGAAWIVLLAVGAAIGALWGAVFGYLHHAATRGARDFASASTLAAMRYDIVARDGYADAARSGLHQAGLLRSL
jgi:hypothetical protein